MKNKGEQRKRTVNENSMSAPPNFIEVGENSDFFFFLACAVFGGNATLGRLRRRSRESRYFAEQEASRRPDEDRSWALLEDYSGMRRASSATLAVFRLALYGLRLDIGRRLEGCDSDLRAFAAGGIQPENGGQRTSRFSGDFERSR